MRGRFVSRAALALRRRDLPETAAVPWRDEVAADVDERQARRATAQLEIEDPAVEGERVVDALDLERDVVDADEPRHEASLASRPGAGTALVEFDRGHHGRLRDRSLRPR